MRPSPATTWFTLVQLWGFGPGCSAFGDEEPDVMSCTAKGCGGVLPEIVFVDEQGQRQHPIGEYRTNGSETMWAFDCVDPSMGTIECVEGRIRPGLSVQLWVDTTLEVRFVGTDGQFTDWQAIPIETMEAVLVDFNGPGCDCMYYEGSASPVVVPEQARQVE
jgi:hypothetical protein